MRRVFIVSDLHLGGRPDEAITPDRPGFRINYSYAALIEFIDWVGRFGAEAELVINGDLVDFLSEDDWEAPVRAAAWSHDEQDALVKMRTAFARTAGPTGRTVADALRELVATGAGCTILLGNHDLELSLPAVRAHLEEALRSGSARPRLVYDGEAYAVGRLLIEHGNRYDAWNVVDHDLLRRERSVRSRGLPLGDTAFAPPPGSELVIRVMNRVKRKHRFVDLLKPETGALLPLLLVLAPPMRQSLEHVAVLAQLAWKRSRHTLAAPARPRQAGDLAAGNDESTALDNLLLDELGDADTQLFRRGPGDLSSADRSRARMLLAALRHLNRGDRSFDTSSEAPEYLSSARTILETGRFDAVVFGHTHLPKAIRFDDGTRYFNTGTWCDVMRLPDSLLTEGAEAEAELERFLTALDANDLERYRIRYPAFVEAVVADGGAVESIALRGYGGPGRERDGVLPDGSGAP